MTLFDVMWFFIWCHVTDSLVAYLLSIFIRNLVIYQSTYMWTVLIGPSVPSSNVILVTQSTIILTSILTELIAMNEQNDINSKDGFTEHAWVHACRSILFSFLLLLLLLTSYLSHIWKNSDLSQPWCHCCIIAFG